MWLTICIRSWGWMLLTLSWGGRETARERSASGPEAPTWRAGRVRSGGQNESAGVCQGPSLIRAPRRGHPCPGPSTSTRGLEGPPLEWREQGCKESGGSLGPVAAMFGDLPSPAQAG